MNEVHSRIVDFERMCRLCLHEKRILMDIFQSTEENYNLSICQKIKACATVHLHRGDGLPTGICVPCLSSLNAAFDFRIQCENADKTLHNIYHLLISDQIRNKESAVVKSDVEKLEGESRDLLPKEQFSDLNHIVVIKSQDIQEKDFNSSADEEKKEKKEVNNLLNMVNSLKKNKELSDCIVEDNLITNNVENHPSNNSLETFLSIQSKKVKKLYKTTFQVSEEKETSEMNLNSKKKVNVITFNENPKQKITGEAKKTACPFCHKMLIRVNEHIRLLHQNKVYICNKLNCKAKFLTLKNLQSHQLKCYNMEKPFKCLKCFKEFHRKCNYKAHVIRHSNKKDFQCQLCDKAFVDSTGLRRHFLKHHEPQQETFISSCCDKKFKTKEGLKQHIQKGICGVQVFEVIESNSEQPVYST